MARFRKMRINTQEAKRLLGLDWEITTIGRPMARLMLGQALNEPIRDYKIGVCCWPEMTENIPLLRDNYVLFKLLWPRSLGCLVDLADFYWNNRMKPLNPLNGFHIPELIGATKFPFHFPERVRAIPFRFCEIVTHVGTGIKVGVDTPEAVIFVECWSHLDDYDTSRFRSPHMAFAVPHCCGALQSYSFEIQVDNIGCNLIILPLGFEYVPELEDDRLTGHVPEREQLYLKKCPEVAGNPEKILRR